MENRTVSESKEKPAPVALKGRVPGHNYPITLSDYFHRYETVLFSADHANKALSPLTKNTPGIDVRLIERLFPSPGPNEYRPFERLPKVLGKAPREKLEFNLRYQDTRIKLAAEDKWGKSSHTDHCRQDAEMLMEIIAILLNTMGPENFALWKSLTDNDLDALMYSVLICYDARIEERWLSEGLKTNELALEGVSGSVHYVTSMKLAELVRYQVFAGTVWWADVEPRLERQFEKMGQLAISDIDLLTSVVLNTNKVNLIFLFDDNGELVWDLLLIRHLLMANPRLKITGVINKLIIANNANVVTLKQCLRHPLFADLENNQRFSHFQEVNYRSAIDPLFCSAALLELIRSSNLTVIKGVSFFETIQGLPVDTFYEFVVHSHDSQICTGLEKGAGVFVKIAKGKSGYRYMEKTLNDLYPAFIH